jgi:hypothetical protein
MKWAIHDQTVGKEKVFWDVMLSYWSSRLDEQGTRRVLVSIH